MKKKKFFQHAIRACITATVFAAVACGGSDDTTVENPSTPANEDKGEVTMTISGNGAEGTGSPSSPIVVERGGAYSMTVSQKSTYTDPDGSVRTCEPKATLKLDMKLDTVYAKDLKVLTHMSESGSTSSSGNSPQSNRTVQTFTVGGQEITFDSQYEVYTLLNSENRKIEMPYVRINPAQSGEAVADEHGKGTRAIGVYVTSIALTPLNKTRSVTVTDSTAYEVSVKFNLDLESVNTKDKNKQNLTFSVNYIGIVETSTEYPDPETAFSYTFNVLGGTKDKVSPFNVTKGETLYLEWKQKIEHTYFSFATLSMQKLNFEPTAYVKLSAESDTIWADKASEFEKVTEGEPIVSITTEENEKNATSQVFDIGGQKISAQWLYEISRAKTPDGEEPVLPYLELGKLKLVSVNAVKKGDVYDVEDIGDKQAEIYEITAKFSQDLTGQKTPDEVKEPLEYIVKYIGAVEIKLEKVKYRKEYVWHEPHDNIPLTSQFIVYRDRIYTHGGVSTDEYRGPLTAVDWGLIPEVPGGGFSTDCEKILSNGVKVFYHAWNRKYTDYGGVVTCRTRVPDIEAFTATVKRDRYNYGKPGENWEDYYYALNGDEHFNSANPKSGWYIKTIEYDKIIALEPIEAINFLRRYNLIIQFRDRFYYFKEGTEEKLFDFVDHQMTFDFGSSDERTTTPEGYPARVIKNDCKARYLGKDFYFSITDTLYQTTPVK